MAQPNKLSTPPIEIEITSPAWKDWINTLYRWQRQEGKWTPTYTGLTLGAPGTFTSDAVYYKWGNLVTIRGRMVGTGGTTFQSVFGTTYINNPPFPVQQETAGVNANDFYESFGRLFNATTGADVGPMIAVYYTPKGTYDNIIFLPTFGPTAANTYLTWEITYQTTA